MDHHRNFGNPVAAWFFRSEHKSKIPAHRQLDSRSDRDCRHTRRSEPVRGHIDLRFVVKIRRSGQDRLPLYKNCETGDSQ